VVRGQIADAEFAAKARAGATEQIRLCLSCNQECVGRMGLNRWLGCIENPRTGRESARSPSAGESPANRRPMDVLVVGAGPAGLQAAIAAARAGHRVTIHERAGTPGGQVRLAATVPNRAEFGDLIRNQLTELHRLGVTVTGDSTVDAAIVRRLAPDHVIVATGAAPQRPWWVGADTTHVAHVADVVEVLDGRAQVHGTVVVIDDIGFHHATSVAELLADRGCAVEIITSAMVVGQDLGITLDMEHWWMRATAKGITQTTDLVPTAWDGTTLQLLHHPTGTNVERAPDWIVLAVPGTPVDALYLELKAEGRSVERVGDCVAPRRAHAAVVEGERAGASVPA
jgi:2,4-dienoyl-CoA reductase (NADPH2)